MSEAEIEKRFSALSHIKVHPRDQQENTALLAQLAAAYENALGYNRDRIMAVISSFQSALETQDPVHIAKVREEIEALLPELDPFHA